MSINLDNFINQVEEMRNKQNEYFRTRNPVVLRESKSLEQNVDRLIRSHREMQSGQTDLFSNEKGARDD